MRVVKVIIPSDKSISHRAIMLASIAEGTAHIKNLLMAEDIKRTIEAFQAMGVSINSCRQGLNLAYSCSKNIVKVCGVGMRGLKKPKGPLYLGNSGTTMRLLPGILAGQDFEVILTGDASLSKRPMQRIVEPLGRMGVAIKGWRVKGGGCSEEVCPPLRIRGGKVKPITYKSNIASAQVKSCLLLAGLFAHGTTSVSEPVKSRDHTERMLAIFGSMVKGEGCRVSVRGPVKLKSPGAIEIPGDISSAAFFIVAGCVLPDIKVVIKDVGLNPTRAGVLYILKKMGADIDFSTRFARSKNIVRARPRSGRVENKEYFEPVGDIVVKTSELKGVTISPREVTRAIDEIPIIMVAACFAKGETIIKGISELRVKETDRIKSMVTNLRKMGAEIKCKQSTEYRAQKREEVIIHGGKKLHGAKVESFGDHRTAMSMMAVGVLANVKVIVKDIQCINKSFPGFKKLLSNFTNSALQKV